MSAKLSEQEWYERAEQRVNHSPRLSAHRDTILYDWQDHGHWRWVATAKVAEIVDWAESVE